MLVLLPIIAALCSIGLWLVLGRPRFLPAAGGKQSARNISVIIPARNEERNLGALLASIRNQGAAPREIMVVDDDSTDHTAAIAAENGARVVRPPPLPGGWNGKPWACQKGAEQAFGDWLLFLDADTRLEPGALEKIAALTRMPDRVSSICPYHTIRRPYEQLSAFFNVVMLAGVNAFGFQRDPSRSCALFGQCLLISKMNYQQIGGHGPVRGEVLENFRLARHLEARGIPRDCYLGRNCVTMRMFPGGFADLWSSWKKGFTRGAAHTAPRALWLTTLWIAGAMLACAGIAMAFVPFVASDCRAAMVAVYVLYAMQCLWAFRLAGNFALLGALFFPCALLFYQALFLTAVIGRKLGIKTRWKDRHVG